MPPKKTVKPKRKYVKKPKQLTMKKMVTNIVKTQMAVAMENKNATITANLGFFQQGSSSIISSYATSLIPSVAQGTGENQRIGNSITCKKLTLRGYLRLNSSGLSGENPYTPGQYNVRIFIGRLKLFNSTPITGNYNELLRSGATGLSFNSFDGLSLVRPVNHEVWTVYYDKIHKIGVSAPANTSTTFNALSGIANNDYPLNKIVKIDLTKYVKKKFVYSDTLTVPNNTGLYLFGAIVDCLASDTILASPPVILDFDTEFSYEDA